MIAWHFAKRSPTHSSSMMRKLWKLWYIPYVIAVRHVYRIIANCAKYRSTSSCHPFQLSVFSINLSSQQWPLRISNTNLLKAYRKPYGMRREHCGQRKRHHFKMSTSWNFYKSPRDKLKTEKRWTTLTAIPFARPIVTNTVIKDEREKSNRMECWN